MIEKIDNLIHQKNLEKYFTKQNFNYFVIGCFCFLGLYLNWSVKELVAVAALIWLILFPLRSQILARIAVVCLLLTLLMLIFGLGNRATGFAEIAYIFIVLMVATLLYEHYHERKT